jgi:hypothetical protein
MRTCRRSARSLLAGEGLRGNLPEHAGERHRTGEQPAVATRQPMQSDVPRATRRRGCHASIFDAFAFYSLKSWLESSYCRFLAQRIARGGRQADSGRARCDPRGARAARGTRYGGQSFAMVYFSFAPRRVGCRRIGRTEREPLAVDSDTERFRPARDGARSPYGVECRQRRPASQEATATGAGASDAPAASATISVGSATRTMPRRYRASAAMRPGVAVAVHAPPLQSGPCGSALAHDACVAQ